MSSSCVRRSVLSRISCTAAYPRRMQLRTNWTLTKMLVKPAARTKRARPLSGAAEAAPEAEMPPAPPSDRELDTYREQADRFIAELDEEFYLHYAGLKESFDLAPIYERHANLTELDQ